MTTHPDAPTGPIEITSGPPVRQAFLLLRTVAPVLFGLDKFFGLLVSALALARLSAAVDRPSRWTPSA